MLNDKQKYLYKAVQEIETVAKKAEKSLKEAEEKTNLRSSMDSVKLEVNEEVEESNQDGLITDTPKKVTGKITTKKKPVVEKNKAEEKRLENMFKPLTPEKILTDIPLIMGSETGKNNNEKILQLHKAGKSNMAIAKELGLGVGEVKLVIDLFQGM